jgi:tetratricopeptide (TPR) repeat protein
MKRTITIFTLMSLVVMILFGANQALLYAKPPAAATDMMASANKLYETGQFAQAAQAYQQLADQGFADSVLYFNLGNAFFKQGDYGRAILNYRRAEQLAPRDEDIATNLELTRARVIDQFEEIVTEPETTVTDGNLVSRLDQVTQQWLTLNELAVITLGVWFLFVVLAMIHSNTSRRSRWRKRLQYGLIAASLVLITGVVSLGSRLYAANNHVEGVIVAGEITVTSGPGSHYVTEFSLPSGTEVRLVEQRENWRRLAIPGSELQGWVPAGAVETITS